MSSRSGGAERKEFEEAPASLKSPVWDYFGFAVQYNDEGVKAVNRNFTVCKRCSKHVPYAKGNTSNMTKHLQRKHPDVNVPEHRTIERHEKVTAAKQQLSIENAFEQTYRATSDKNKKITRAVGAFIAKDLQPFSVVEDVGFRHLIKTLDPRYVVPCRTHFSSVIIPGLYDQTRKAIENDLAQTQSLALTTDSWTSRATESYLTVTVHYTLDWQMKSAVLQTRPLYESHTSAHLAEELRNVMTDWKLERPNMTIPVATDNAPNIVNAVNETDGLGPQISCFAHTVNLAVKKALSINGVSRLLGKVRKVVTFFHKSTTAHQALTAKQEMLNLPKHKLIHDVTTRWNTAHDMLARYVEQQPAIYSALTMDKNLRSHLNMDMAMLTDTEQKMAEQLIEVLKPLKTVTTLMSSETTPTISMILPLKEMILKSMTPGDKDYTAIKEAKEAIARDLGKRYTDPDLQKYLQKATALDPRFKSLPGLDGPSLYSDLATEILEHEPQVFDHHVLYDFMIAYLIINFVLLKCIDINTFIKYLPYILVHICENNKHKKQVGLSSL